MRIAMFMPALGPDALGWRVHCDFAEAIERLGHDFRLLTTPAPAVVQRRPPGGTARTEPLTVQSGETTATLPGDPGATQAAEPPSARSITVLEESAWSHRLATAGRPFLRTRQLAPAAGALSRYLKQHGADIDLLHLEVAYPHGAAGMLATMRSGWDGLVGITPMGEDVLVVADRSYGMRRHVVPAALVNRTLRRAAALRCISPMFEQHIAALSPDNPRRVIPLNMSAEATEAAGADSDSAKAFRAAARARVDEDFGTAGRPLVLSFGRLHPFKGIDYLVDAAAAIGDATVLLSDGPMIRTVASLSVRPFGDIATLLRRRADEKGVADKVNVAGGVHPSRALEILAAADAVVVPSPLESLNKVCMEAAAVGTPFVVTETTGISAWVPSEGVGIVVPPRNSACLAWAIEEIIGGHFAYDAEAAAGFALRFSPDRIAGEVMDFYEEIAESRGG